MLKPVEIKGVAKSFGKSIVLDNISFDVEKGDVFYLLGPNGAGKSTLLNCLMSVLIPLTRNCISALNTFEFILQYLQYQQ